jgi:hypothetical protein
MTAYQQRLAPETRVKISRLDVLPSDGQISGSNLPQPRVSWPALCVFYPIVLIGLSSMRNDDSKNMRQDRRSAQAALKSCGSLEQRRDLGDLPDLNVFECRACGMSLLGMVVAAGTDGGTDEIRCC